jgi:hypothetical protein
VHENALFFLQITRLRSYKNECRKFNLNMLDFYNLFNNNELKKLLNGEPSPTHKNFHELSIPFLFAKFSV